MQIINYRLFGNTTLLLLPQHCIFSLLDRQVRLQQTSLNKMNYYDYEYDSDYDCDAWAVRQVCLSPIPKKCVPTWHYKLISVPITE
jgi:hypothetical protein